MESYFNDYYYAQVSNWRSDVELTPRGMRGVKYRCAPEYCQEVEHEKVFWDFSP